MISERNLLQDALGAVFIKGCTSTVFALKGHHPLQPALETLIPFLTIIGWDFAQREENHRRVVHIGIPFVFIFKDPPAGFHLGWIFVNPVSSKTNLFAHQPLGCLFQARVVTRDSGFAQTNHYNRSIPNRRKSRLDSYGIRGLMFELLKPPLGA